MTTDLRLKPADLRPGDAICVLGDWLPVLTKPERIFGAPKFIAIGVLALHGPVMVNCFAIDRVFDVRRPDKPRPAMYLHEIQQRHDEWLDAMARRRTW